MKLIELLKITDTLSDIVIWIEDDLEEPFYKGPVLDVPWHLGECEMYRGLDDGENMVRVSKDEDGKAVLVVSVKEI